jgi:hypothetical protein
MKSPSNRRGDATEQTSDKCYSEAAVASPLTVQALRLRWMAAQSEMVAIADALYDLSVSDGQELAEFWAATDVPTVTMQYHVGRALRATSEGRWQVTGHKSSVYCHGRDVGWIRLPAAPGHEIRHTLAQRQAAAAERNARLSGTDPSWYGQ